MTTSCLTQHGVGYEQFIPMMADCSPLLLDLNENEHCGIQAYACNTESQEDLYAEVPLVGRLTGIEEVKVEAIAMSKLHNMSCPPYMGHSAAVISI